MRPWPFARHHPHPYRCLSIGCGCVRRLARSTTTPGAPSLRSRVSVDPGFRQLRDAGRVAARDERRAGVDEARIRREDAAAGELVEQDDGQVALQVGLLVDREVELAVLDGREHGGREVERAGGERALALAGA